MIVVDHVYYPKAYSLINGVKRFVFDDVYYYAIGDDPPHYPVPALINWGKLPPPDIVRLMSGGMFHHWNSLI